MSRRGAAVRQIFRLAGSALRFLLLTRRAPRSRRERKGGGEAQRAEIERLRAQVAELEEQVELISTSTSAEAIEAYKDRVAELQRLLEEERERTK